MRVASAFIVAAATVWSSAAHASSFVVLPAMTDDFSPSIVELGQAGTPDVNVLAAIPAPAQPPIAEPGHIDIISPSIIAMGEPAVADENVAAIDGGETKKSGPSTMPMVIRGGVVGDAFSAPSSASIAVEPQAAAQEPSSSESVAKPGSEPTAPEPSTPEPRPAGNALKPE
jgi:hypothetical protein